MITNNKIKEIKSLGQTKFRQKYNKFIAEGSKTVNQFLQSNTYSIEEIYVTKSYLEKYESLLKIHNRPWIVIDQRTMKKITHLTHSTEILIVVNMKEEIAISKVWEEGYYIYLDDVQDPGNVGTIIRLADWYGFKRVIRSEGSADFYNPKVVQSTMGSMTGIELLTASHEQITKLNIPLYGAIMEGTPIHDVSWTEQGILIMGNEGRGISDYLLTKLTHRVSIQGHPDRSAESLNVGIATGIISNEIFAKAIKK